jgi:hypothetical protein
MRRGDILDGEDINPEKEKPPTGRLDFQLLKISLGRLAATLL